MSFKYSADQKTLVILLSKAGISYSSGEHEVRVGDPAWILFKFNESGLLWVEPILLKTGSREPADKKGLWALWTRMWERL